MGKDLDAGCWLGRWFGEAGGKPWGGRQGYTRNGLAHYHRGYMRHHVECVPIVPLREGEARKISTGTLVFFCLGVAHGCQLPTTSGLS